MLVSEEKAKRTLVEIKVELENIMKKLTWLYSPVTDLFEDRDKLLEYRDELIHRIYKKIEDAYRMINPIMNAFDLTYNEYEKMRKEICGSENGNN